MRIKNLYEKGYIATILYCWEFSGQIFMNRKYGKPNKVTLDNWFSLKALPSTFSYVFSCIFCRLVKKVIRSRIPSRNPFSVNITNGETLLTGRKNLSSQKKGGRVPGKYVWRDGGWIVFGCKYASAAILIINNIWFACCCGLDHIAVYEH